MLLEQSMGVGLPLHSGILVLSHAWGRFHGEAPCDHGRAIPPR
jgi:hypothetical protein